MLEIIGKIFGILGGCCIGLGFILGAFLLHWIFGIIVTGIVLIIFSTILFLEYDYQNDFFIDD